MKIPLRLLIVEDSEEDAFFLLRTLKQADYDITYERVQTADAQLLPLLK